MLPSKIKNSVTNAKKKLKPRLPLDAVLKLHRLPVPTRKGKKGYDRKRMQKEAEKSIEEDG
jgi:hypothetical protein